MIDQAKTTQFIGKLLGDLGGAVIVPMARIGGYSARRPAPLPGARKSARLSQSREGAMLQTVFGLTMVLAIGGPISSANAQDPTARCVAVGNEQMTIASAQGRGLAIENFSEVETPKFLAAFNAMAPISNFVATKIFAAVGADRVYVFFESDKDLCTAPSPLSPDSYEALVEKARGDGV
jgi:hypothetical protein